MTRIFEPGDLRLRMRSCQGFGDVGGYVCVVAAEEEELRHGRFPQQLVAILAQEHAFQQGDDTRVFSKEDLVGQVLSRGAFVGAAISWLGAYGIHE